MTRRLILLAVTALLAALVAMAPGSAQTPARTAPSGTSSEALAARRSTGPGVDLAADGTIGHAGRWLTDPEGRVVLVHGVNLVAKGTDSPAQEGFDADDADWLAANGFDVVRLGLVAADVMPTPGVIDQSFLDSFQSTVDTLTERGLLVLVDLHQDGWGPTLGSDGFPDWMTITNGATNTHTGFPLYYLTNPAIQAAFDSFWTNVDGPGGVPLQDRVGAIFSALASRFASNPGVLGYDLINEPWPGSTYADCLNLPGGCPTLDHDRLDPYDASMDAAIRAAGDHHLVFAEPWVLFNFGQSQTNIGLPGGDADSGMAYHMYPATPDAEPNVLANAQSWSAGTGGALLQGEFGATQTASDIDRMVDETDGALIPWIWWSYDEEIVPDMHTPPGGTNLVDAAADALVRPHAVLVAGTPTAESYDEASQVLTFTQSTAYPAGDRPAAGASTEVVVPDRPYPDGWHATATGGTITSAPGASPVVVLPDPGATTVTITVSPGAPPPTSTTSTSTTSIPTTTSTSSGPAPNSSGSTTVPVQVAVEPSAAAEAVSGEPSFTG